MLNSYILVLGILIALGVDDWRQERDDQIAEREYLLTIKADLESDLQRFDERIFPEIEIRLEKSEIFQQGLRNVARMAQWQRFNYKAFYEDINKLLTVIDEEIDRLAQLH